MYQPLEHIAFDADKHGAWRCRVPFCWGWDQASHGLCAFHEKFARGQVSERFAYDPDDVTADEARQLYAMHRERERRCVPFHLIMALLWPGPAAEQRYRSTKREAAMQARWSEENDRA